MCDKTLRAQSAAGPVLGLGWLTQVPVYIGLFIQGLSLILLLLLLFGMQAVVAQAAPLPRALCDLTAEDEASLTLAITCVNGAGAGTHTITLTADISLTQPLPVLTNPLATAVLIEGDGHTLDANGTGRVLTLESVPNLTLQNITLTGGQTDINGVSPDGGGLSLNCGEDLDCQWTLLNTTVANNGASSGAGIRYRCDYHGGGTLLIQDSVIRNNRAASVGGGLIYSADEESGLCAVTLRNTLIEGNQALAGGALRIWSPRVTIIDSTIRNNIATEDGGGIMARKSDGFIDMTVRNSTISGNQAGQNGGGLFIESPEQTFAISLVNSTVSSNTATSGAGGGLYLGESNDSLRIAFVNSTVTQNAAAQGAGVHIFHSDSSFEITGTLRLTNSIIADNLGSDCRGELAGGGLFSGQRVTSFGHNLDSDGTCLTPEVRQASDIADGNANLGPLANNGGATQTHALLAGSAAIDAGDDAACAAEPVNGVDQRGEPRPQGLHCDIGAYESAAPVARTLLFVSSRSSGRAGDLAFRDEDILAYDASDNRWAMIFDGSDVGITKDVNAFAVKADGSLLLSFNGPTTVPGLGPVDDSDIVRFIPTALGSQTAGSFVWFLHGADVGLDTDSEDIDAIGFTAEGQLVISTIGNFQVPSASGKDEDLWRLDNGTFGNPSRGEWSLLLDGSTVGLANEDINGVWIDPANGEFYLTVKDQFAFAQQTIDANDIFVCTLSPAGQCSYRFFWAAEQHGYSANNIDGFDIGRLPAALNAIVQESAAETVLDADAWQDDDSDDLDITDIGDIEEENILRLFLPIVTRAVR